MNEKFIEITDSLNLVFPAKEIAEKMGYDAANIGKYLNNKRKAGRKFLMNFCNAFNLDYNILFKPQKSVEEVQKEAYNQILLDLLLEEVAKLKASIEKKDTSATLKEIDMLAKSRLNKLLKRLGK